MSESKYPRAADDYDPDEAVSDEWEDEDWDSDDEWDTGEEGDDYPPEDTP